MSAGENEETLTAFISRTSQAARPAVLVAAFEGWNDAGTAASDAVRQLLEQSDAQHLATVGDDDFYDYQFSRPRAVLHGSVRTVHWPQTDIYRISRPAEPADLLVVVGVGMLLRRK